jgi:hypothetical protein
MSDKKISELSAATSINQSDVSVLVSGGVDYKFAFSTLLQFLGTNLTVGANISFGTILPQNTLGKNGDVFINTSIGTFAQKISETWNIVYALPSVNSLTDGTVLYGLGIPGTLIGNNNDTYIDTGTGIFYKKAAGSWSQTFSMQTGPQGAQGTAGINGTNGTNGFTILNGGINPSNLSTGTNGDFYINTSNYTFFGPKTAGAWPDGVSLISPGVIAGGFAGQALTKASDDDYDTEWVNLDDLYVRLNGSYSSPSWINSLDWTKISSKPTTIAGYGITDFNTLGDARWLQLSGGTLTGDVQQPVSPMNANSLINKNYVDNLITGLTWKKEVKAGTISNITLSGIQTIDSIALVAGDRVLVKDQTTQSQNGIYVVASGSWTRTTDADTTDEIEGATVMVRLGTVNKDTQWTNTNSNEPVIGTDAIIFGQIAGAGTYTNGTGINLTANVFSLNKTYTDTLYVPYTGATANVDLGVSHTLSGGALNSTGGDGSSGQLLGSQLKLNSNILRDVGANAGFQMQTSAGAGYMYFRANGTIERVSDHKIALFQDDAVPYTGATANIDIGNHFFSIGNSGQMSVGDYTTGKSVRIQRDNISWFDSTGSGNRVLLQLSNTGNYTISLPPTGGTLALTSDLTSGYVPYTGATGTVNLGTNGISTSGPATFGNQTGTVNAVVINGPLTNNGQAFFNRGITMSDTASVNFSVAASGVSIVTTGALLEQGTLTSASPLSMYGYVSQAGGWNRFVRVSAADLKTFLSLPTGGTIANNTSLQTSASWNIDGTGTVTKNGIGTIVTDGLLLSNTTASTSFANTQFSPALRFSGTRWTGSASQQVETRMSTSTDLANQTLFKLDYRFGSTGGYNEVFAITPAGHFRTTNLDVNGDLTASIITGSTYIVTPQVIGGSGQFLSLRGEDLPLTGGTAVKLWNFTAHNNSSGTLTEVSIEPKYNQTGAAGTTDLAIDRTETAIGSGAHFFADFKVGGISKFTIDRLGVVTLGAWKGTAIADTYISSASNWNTAYTDRNKWDGGATGLVAATGRASLGLGSAALISDSTLAHLSGTETITGQKTFTANVYFTNHIDILNGAGSGSITSAATTAARTYNLPDKDGTFAMEADVLHLAGIETITSKKTFSDTLTLTGLYVSAYNAGGGDFTPYASSNTFGKTIVGNNYSNSLGETNIINIQGSNTPLSVGGIKLQMLTVGNTMVDLMSIQGDTLDAVFAKSVVVKSPDGTNWRINVSNAGVITASAV